MMKFEKYIPSTHLRPYIKYFVVSENTAENEYKVFPPSGLVAGFQFKGHLTSITGNSEQNLASAGVTGISDRYKIFKNSHATGSVLVYFTETGFVHFVSHPVNELFNLSISLDNIFNKEAVRETEEKLALVTTDAERIKIVEQLLLSQLKSIQVDKLIVNAVKLIFENKGSIRIRTLNEKLDLSPSAFEKRFRKVVGTTPKKFASIIRFNCVLNNLQKTTSLIDICYENNFFDQAHFIKDFKQFTGDTPENFKRFL